MIESVINLRGEHEPYSAEKLVHWIQESTTGFDKNEWFDIAVAVASDAPKVITVQKLMRRLIAEIMRRNTYSAQLMAGSLMATLIKMEVFGSKTAPSVREVQERLAKLRLMRRLAYSQREWAIIEQAVDHSMDHADIPLSALEQMRVKYSLKDFATNAEFETPQFVYMRMAMSVFEKQTDGPDVIHLQDANSLFNENYENRSRIEHVLRMYQLLSEKILSAPTPNYNNLGTYHFGLASCCVIASGDDRFSLNAGDTICTLMTTQSAGLGLHVMARSIKDAVQNGRFLHLGKKPLVDVFGKLTRAYIQGGRGGAGNFFFSIYDPEARMLAGLRDTRATDEFRNRDVHYAFLSNRYFMAKVANEEQIFVWNCYTAPKLHTAFYGPNLAEFVEEYERLENDPTFVKTYVSARDLMNHALTQSLQTGSIYGASIDEMNRNTPFIDPIHSSNLCMEVALPNYPYSGPSAMHDMMSTEEVGYSNFSATSEVGEVRSYATAASKVYRQKDGVKWSAGFARLDRTFMDEGVEMTITHIEGVKPEPEVALCSLGAMNVTEEVSNARYKDGVYYCYRMIDYCIENNEYIIPHIGVTARARRNAGMGIMGVATHMARRKLKYSSKEGLQELHKLAERHLYYAIEAAIQISKERGLAPWIERTKWVDGWTPLETYRREVDDLADFTYQFDWVEISARIKANGGLAFSSLINFMPGESSSKGLGAANCYYGVRETHLLKTDSVSEIDWIAPYSDNPDYEYESMFDVHWKWQNAMHAVFQKFNDQAASADRWKDFRTRLTIPTQELLDEEFDRVRLGGKTYYYTNTMMPVNEKKSMELSKSVHEQLAEEQLKKDLESIGVSFVEAGADNKIDCEGCGA